MLELKLVHEYLLQHHLMSARNMLVQFQRIRGVEGKIREAYLAVRHVEMGQDESEEEGPTLPPVHPPILAEGLVLPPPSAAGGGSAEAAGMGHPAG